MGFSPEVAERALLACARHCCLCHKLCGSKIETHHILQGGGDTFENCIPLCFDCHAEVGAYNTLHPKGKKFSVTELQGHRDRWYQLVRDGKYRLPDSNHQVQKALLNHDAKEVGSEHRPTFVRQAHSTLNFRVYVEIWKELAQLQSQLEGLPPITNTFLRGDENVIRERRMAFVKCHKAALHIIQEKKPFYSLVVVGELDKAFRAIWEWHLESSMKWSDCESRKAFDEACARKQQVATQIDGVGQAMRNRLQSLAGATDSRSIE